MNHFAFAGDQSRADNFVSFVDRNTTFGHEKTQKGCNVRGEHLTGMKRHRGRHIERSKDEDTTMLDRFTGTGSLAIPATLGRDIDDDRTAAHGLDHIRRDENWGFASGYGGCCDDYVRLPKNLGKQLPLAAIEALVHSL